MKRRLLTLLGVLLSGLILVYLARAFDLEHALKVLRMAEPGWLALATLVYLVQFPLRGLRWSVLMRRTHPVSVRTATEVFAIGFLANNVLPARLGDVARGIVLAKRESIPASATLANVLLERVLDGLVVVGFLAGVLLLAPPGAPWVQTVGALMGALFLSAVLVAILVARQEARVVALARVVLGWLPPRFLELALGLLMRLALGVRLLRSARDSAVALLLSLAVWSGEAVVYVIAQRAFGLDLPPHAMLVVMAVLTLGLTAPSAPGFVGVYEGCVVQALELYGVTGGPALAFAITMHLIHFIPGTVFGLWAAWRGGLSVRELGRTRTGEVAGEVAQATPR